MSKIDLNADMGESLGIYRPGHDAELLRLVTCANIACGWHAGDPQVMDETIALALELGVGVGAHPGYPDLVGFGRRALAATPREIEGLTLYQIGALSAFAQARGKRLTHCKPHGALYNRAAQDLEVALAIGRGIARFDPGLIYVGQAQSAMIEAAQKLGLAAAREGFCDRAYEANGMLRARGEPGAVHADPAAAAAQAVQIATTRTVTAHSGEVLPLEADTLCIHGDSRRAVEAAQAVRRALAGAGVEVKALHRS